MFKGSMVAIVTPFSNGRVDEKKLKDLIEIQINNGTSGIVPCGTTGESATLSIEEHERVVKVTVQAAAGRVPVIAGTGSNNTAEAIRLTKHAQRAGANGVLLISPYYNKPTQNGIYLHFQAIAEEVDIPIILYIEPHTVAKLAQIKNIVAIKEASGNVSQMAQIKQLCGDKIALISGDDALTLPVLAIGGVGVISVVANLVPAQSAKITSCFDQGNLEGAREAYYHLLPLIKAMFSETNPGPVKTALSLMGLIEPELRLPLSPMLPENKERLTGVLKEYKLI